MNPFRTFVSSLALAAVMLYPAVTLALDVDDARWGFDGRILTSEFNPLFVLVSNPTDEPFDGVLKLTHASSGGSPVGARMVERIYLANHSSRWVQFYPYCSSSNDIWTVRWQGQSFPVPPPRVGDDEPVLLDEANSFSSAGRGIKHFNEDLFPPSVTATHTLSTIVIDRVPRWEAPRRQAFMDWLRLGGTVHLLHAADGQFPKFTNELAELNSPLTLQRIGAGVVFRHDWPREAIDSESLAEMESTRKRFVESLSGGTDDPEILPDTKKGANSGQPRDWNEVYGIWDSDNHLFGVLKKLTRPDHNWALIYLLSFVYIGLIFPGCFLLGRRRAHYLVTYGAIIGCVALFSLIFLIVGRRGYGEATKVNTIAYAQQIEGDQWDVDLFGNVFATAGDTYEITHQGESGLYATCATMESVNGDIDSGVNGSFSVDIPPFSNRPFAHRMKIRLPQLPVTKTAFEATDRLTRLELKVGESFPKEPVSMFVQFRHNFYIVTRRGDVLHAEPTRLECKSFLKLNDYRSFFGAGSGGWLFGEEPEAAQKDFRELWRPLVARQLGILEGRRVKSYSLPTDRARLFVFTEAPVQLRVDSDRFPEQSGLVLYAFDILRNEI
jgi:hypothetical protein